MILVVPFLASALSVVALGGRLSALAELRLRWSGLLCLALALQLTVLGPLAGLAAIAHGVVHVLSFLAAGVFVLANRGIPGLWLVGVGGASNLAAVAANGGVMPASPAAVAFAGLEQTAGEFHNSGVVADANLALLGDVLALPASWPLANVFSVGDVLLVLGGAVVLHSVCGSRLSREGRRRHAETRCGRPIGADAGEAAA